MKIVYFILAHKNPDQLANLIAILDNQHSEFIVHIDKSLSHDEFQMFREIIKAKKVHFIQERLHTYWGSFNLVQATLNAFDFIKNNYLDYDRIVLLSGQDFPIKSSSHILSFFQSKPNAIFVEYNRIPYVKWFSGGTYRFPYYDYMTQVLTFFCGSQWFSLNVYTIKILLEFIENNEDLITYFKSVNIPDESFFQTVLLNCDDDYIYNNLVNANLHLIEWEESPNFPLHPKIFSSEDIRIIKSSEKLFARKFDPTFPFDKLID